MDKKPSTNDSMNESQELINLKNDLNSTREFLELVRFLDKLPQMEKTSYDATRSLYQVVSRGRDIRVLEKKLETFFGSPHKASGKPMPMSLRFSPLTKYLRGIRDEQSLFLKKTKEGFFYAALWPWLKTPENITVHLGYISNKMSKKDYNDLEKLVKTNVLKEKIFKEFDADKESRIHGISIASFMQMAMFEKISCTLEIKTTGKAGRLSLLQGELIAAETGRMKNKAAAYEILSWENTSVELREQSGKKTNEINQGILEILSEALKLRSEGAQEHRTTGKTARTSGGKPSDERYRKLLGSTQAVGKKRLLPFFAIVLGVLLIVAISVVFFTRILKPEQIKSEFDTLLVQVERLNSLEEKEIMLQEFINSNPQDTDTEKAENKIKEIRNAIEKQDFQTTLKNVKKLTIDSDYEKEATAIYTSYLTKHPDGVYENKIKDKILEIPSLIEDADFEKLSDVAQNDYNIRFEAYHAYLLKHSQGRHKSKVEEFISNLGEEYYNHLAKEVPVCEQQKQWDKCIELCSGFIDFFKTSHRLDEVGVLKRKLQDKKDFGDMAAKVKQKGNDYEAAKKIYTDYIFKNPDTSEGEKIENELSEIEKKIDEKNKWEAVVAYSKNSQYSISEKLWELKNYLRQNSSGPYVENAKAIIERLQTKNQAMENRRIEEQRNRQLAGMQREKERIKREKDKILVLIKKSSGRYVVNNDGTFTDTKTNLTWCLLDSRMALNKCLDYKSSQKYVKNLETGGYGDWRLPYSSELAGLYKNEPFFPDKRTRWYWTSEVFIKGYYKNALIVTSKHEKVYKRQEVNLDKCGWVRAVRP